MVLFAPALSVNLSVRMLSLLRVFGPSYLLPARAPKKYRAYDKVPLRAFLDYFGTLEKFKNAINKRLHVPALIFVDREDELIDVGGMQKLIVQMFNAVSPQKLAGT